MLNVVINSETEYLIFDTPYIYPHNWYFGYNKDYLYTKISYSINFMKYFVDAYKNSFTSGVPLMYIKENRESKDYYEIDLILKEYLTISYLKTDIPTGTIYFHLLLENDKKNGQTPQYHQITVSVQRLIRSGTIYCKFITNIL